MRQQLSSDSESQSSLGLEESAGKEDPVELDSKKGAEDLEEDIGKTLTQVKDGADRALSATKGALLEALEKYKVTAKTELTKEREEAEGPTWLVAAQAAASAERKRR